MLNEWSNDCLQCQETNLWIPEKNIKSHYNLFQLSVKFVPLSLICYSPGSFNYIVQRPARGNKDKVQTWTRCIFRWCSTSYCIFILRPSARSTQEGLYRDLGSLPKKPAFLRKLKARGYFRWRMWRCSLRKWPFLSKPQSGPRQSAT